MKRVDAIIIGGGPAGSTCAWKLRRAGVDTIVIDKQAFPRTKLCAGWITPKVLRDLELSPQAYPHSLLRFDRLHIFVHGRKFIVRTRQYSIRRYEFDHWLLQRAGVPVHQHTVKNIRQDGEFFIVDGLYRCKYLIGAGGTNCPVYRTFFAERNPRAEMQRIVAMEEEFPYAFHDSNCYLWFFEKNLPGYSWYVPKGDGYLNVGIGGKYAAIRERGQTIREHWQALARKLAALGLVPDYEFQPRGYNYYLRQNVRHVRAGNAFILGDAAGLATKDMGEGIGPAIESGLLAARAVAEGVPYSLKSVTRYSFPAIFMPWRYRLPKQARNRILEGITSL